jgi:RNA methyltransferase, TrmH family
MPPAYVPGRSEPGEDPDRTTVAVAAVLAARRAPELVLLEGVHAIRFGASIEAIVTPDAPALRRLLDHLAPDVRLPVAITALSAGAWQGIVGRALPSPVVAVARRPATSVGELLARPGRVVVLEQPRHLGNLGAVVRVAAAAGAAGVLVVGEADPWSPTAVRAAAGLQFAVAVARSAELPATDRPMIAMDADGADGGTTGLPEDALLLVGTERGGLSAELRGRATAVLSLPMRPGVSSLNLATAVAVALYLPSHPAARP